MRAGAKIVDFGGWDMPLVYTSIQEEHLATRASAGLFDVSHMGRIAFRGPDTVPFLDHVLTNHVESMKPGQVRYSLVLNESAGVLDDVLLYRLDGRHLLVVNASNRTKILTWLHSQRQSHDVQIRDETDETAMMAVQGPKALELAASMLERSPAALAYYSSEETSFEGQQILVSRTGYTGEDGVEIMGPASAVASVWDRLLSDGAYLGVRATGLGARDTLRLEAGMPLYGHELTEAIDPVQAGLAWAVKADVKNFVGKSALLGKPTDRPVRVGLLLDGRRIARERFDVSSEAERIGWVTSGTFSPTLQQSIAMAYARPALAAIGQKLIVDIRGVQTPARVVPLPFYRRPKNTGDKL